LKGAVMGILFEELGDDLMGVYGEAVAHIISRVMEKQIRDMGRELIITTREKPIRDALREVVRKYASSLDEHTLDSLIDEGFRLVLTNPNNVEEMLRIALKLSAREHVVTPSKNMLNISYFIQCSLIPLYATNARDVSLDDEEAFTQWFGNALHRSLIDSFVKLWGCSHDVEARYEHGGYALVGKPDLVCPGDLIIEFKFRRSKIQEPHIRDLLQAATYSYLLNKPRAYLMYVYLDGTAKAYSVNSSLGKIVIDRFTRFVDNLNKGIYEPTIRVIPCDKCRFREVCPYFGKPVEPVKLSLMEAQATVAARSESKHASNGSNGSLKSKVVGQATCPVCGADGGVYVALRSTAYYLYMLHGIQKHYVGRASDWIGKLSWKERNDEILERMGLLPKRA